MYKLLGRIQVNRIISVFLVGFVLLLTACISPIGTTTQPNADTTEPIHIKVGTSPILSNVVLQIAETEGYFTEEGLSVELVPFQSPREFIPLLLNGQLDVAQPALTAGFFNAVAKSDKLKMVLPVTNFKVQECAYTAFFVRRADMETGIYREPSSWQGARIALSPAGAQSSAGYLTDRFLQQAGLGLDDVELPIVDLAIQAEALRTGQADIVLVIEPWVTRMKADSDLALLMPAEPYALDLTASALLYGAKLLDNRELGTRFAVAYLKAVRQYRQGTTPRNVEIITDSIGLDPATASLLCLADIPADGQINVDSVMDYQAWLVEQELLDLVVPPTDFIDTRFVTEARRILGDAQ